MLEAIGTGSTIVEAEQNACEKLNKEYSEDESVVQFEVLELPTKKLFGLLGRTPAKVRAFINVSDDRINTEKNNSKTNQIESKIIKKENPQKVINQTNNTSAKIQSNNTQTVKNYLGTIIPYLGIENSDTEIIEKNNDIFISITGDFGGNVIGYRGEVLDSLQYLCSLVANHNHDKDYIKVHLDIGGYREKREITLANLAKKMAQKAIKYNRSFSLEPMNPNERRIIHVTIQNIDGVKSWSDGSGFKRHIIIAPDNKLKNNSANKQKQKISE